MAHPENNAIPGQAIFISVDVGTRRLPLPLYFDTDFDTAKVIHSQAASILCIVLPLTTALNALTT